MCASDLKLLGAWLSPFAIRPRITLYLKHIDYEFVEENLGSKSELLLNCNPIYKKVPVLIHNNKSICESLVILQYIDDVFTSAPSLLPSDPYDRAIARFSLLPSDPYDRAIAHFWAAYVDEKLYSSSLSGSFKGKNEEEKAAGVEGVTTGMALLEEAFQKISQGKGFFGGETIGYLDIVLGSILGWIRVGEKFSGSTYIDQTKTPGLYGWVERFVVDAAVKDFLPETDKLVEFTNACFDFFYSFFWVLIV